MARGKIPDPLERRHLVDRELAPAHAQKIADAYLEEGRSLEALDFLVKAGATARLEELRREAVADGDAFMLRVVSRALGGMPSPASWTDVASAAEAAGKQRYAEDARRQAGRGEE